MTKQEKIKQNQNKEIPKQKLSLKEFDLPLLESIKEKYWNQGVKSGLIYRFEKIITYLADPLLSLEIRNILNSTEISVIPYQENYILEYKDKIMINLTNKLCIVDKRFVDEWGKVYTEIMKFVQEKEEQKLLEEKELLLRSLYPFDEIVD